MLNLVTVEFWVEAEDDEAAAALVQYELAAKQEISQGDSVLGDFILVTGS